MTEKISIQSLVNIYASILMASGFNQEDAYIGADVLATSDIWGDSSHGGMLLGKFLRLARDGGMDPHSDIEVLNENASWALVDGNAGLGHVISCKCMKLAISKARKSGIGMVGVRRSMHFGCAGYYALMAAKEEMIGLAMSNVNPVMTIPGACGRIIGNNPIAYAAPTGTGRPVFLDIAMSKVAGAKIHQAKNTGKSIPEGWLVDFAGEWITDPQYYNKNGGALLPMADHKGYGLAVMMEILAGVLTGAGITDKIGVWDEDYSVPSNQGHFFVAIDIEKLIPLNMFKERMDYLVNYLKNSPKINGNNELFVPGEMELNREEQARKEGVLLEGHVIRKLRETAGELGIKIDL